MDMIPILDYEKKRDDENLNERLMLTFLLPVSSAMYVAIQFRQEHSWTLVALKHFLSVVRSEMIPQNFLYGERFRTETALESRLLTIVRGHMRRVGLFTTESDAAQVAFQEILIGRLLPWTKLFRAARFVVSTQVDNIVVAFRKSCLAKLFKKS